MTALRLMRCVLCLVCVCVCVCSLEMHGHVQSPLYPKPYPQNLHQQWDLEVPPGYQIQITFSYLDIESSPSCYYDSLLVLHGRKVLGKFCGQNSSDPHHPGNKLIVSPSNRLQLVFVTDDSNPENNRYLGFSAFYQALDTDECSAPGLLDSDSRCSQICLNTLGSYLCACYHGYQLRPDQRTCTVDCGGGVFTELEGGFSSPGYPNAAPLGLSCNYTISVPPGFHVTLNFSRSFHIEPSHPDQHVCIFHFLQVSVAGEAPRTFCGDKSPGVLETHSDRVELLFHTDRAGESRGFSLVYTTDRVECEVKEKITNGKITPEFPNYFYRDYIHVRCDTGYQLVMEGREVKSFKATCQADGTWHLPIPQCKIINCGNPKSLLNGDVQFVSGSGNEYGAVVQYHCNEPFYKLSQAAQVKVTCAADRKWKTFEGSNEVLHCFPVCGLSTVDISGRRKVYGGDTAKKGAFPWQVFLMSGGRAGAMVIGEQWLLTAAHNLEKASADTIQAYVGSIHVNELTSFPPLPVQSLHVHPGYKSSDFDNDLALIKLSSPITFNEDVMPVCLPAQDTELQRFGWVSGFGVSEETTSINSLNFINLPVVEQQACNASLEAAKASHDRVSSLTENMFCAGLPEGGKDTCQGDSGSAFVMKDQGVFSAVGIVSWGVDCGLPGKYGVYTRVARYTDWINKIMQEHQDE